METIPKKATDKSDALWARALKVIPSGTQTFSKGPGQYVKGVAPKYVERGKGGRVWDVDGNEFVDFGMALGPIILGYANERVDAAIRAQLKDGITYTLMHPLEVQLAEKLTQVVPCAEMVRFGKNGSDATAGAIRLARAYTRRDKVAVCGYHGWQDWYIGSTTRNAGVPKAVRDLTIPFKYNDLDSIRAVFAANPGEIAAVILEPANFVQPNPGYLAELKDLTHQHGALLVFDEVITGFRWAIGGAQAYFGVTPDLSSFGKAMGNGMPISSVVGRADVMRLYDEVFFSFTFGGETLSLAASLATIDELERERGIEKIWATGAALKNGFNGLVSRHGLSSVARCVGFDCWPEYEFVGPDGKNSFELQTLFTQEIIKRGVLTRPGMFVCVAHDRADVDQTLGAFSAALQRVKEALDAGDVKARIEGDLIQPVIRASS